jgi:hypothetical protein
MNQGLSVGFGTVNGREKFAMAQRTRDDPVREICS